MRFGAVSIAMLAVSLSSFAADPFVGTWNPNAAKIKMGPGGTPGRAAWVYTFEGQGENLYHVTTTTPDGKAQFDGVWHLDGKAGTPNKNGVTVSMERVGQLHIRVDRPPQKVPSSTTGPSPPRARL